MRLEGEVERFVFLRVPSIAAPSWQARRVEPLMVLFLERITRLKGADWLVYWARAVEVKTAAARARAENCAFMLMW